MSADLLESWLLTFLARGGAIAVAWCAIGFLLRSLSASRVSAWWRGGILALLIVAALPPEMGLLRIPLTSGYQTQEQASSVADSSTPSAVPPVLDTNTIPKLMESSASPIAVSWIWLWLFGTLVLGVRLLLGHLRVAALIRSAKQVSDADVLAMIAEERGAGLQKGSIGIKVHEGIRTPFATGLFRPILVLPECAMTGGELLRMMIRHELAHFERADIAWQILAELAVILHWPNPFAWMVKQRLRLAHESAADDQVLTSGFDGPSYASLLFNAAQGECRLSGEATIVPMAQPSTLRRRIGSLLDANRSREHAGPLARILMVGVGGIAAVAFGFRAETEDGQENTWSRSYRDTLRLEKSFADRFTKQNAEALAEFRSELTANGVLLSDSVKLELSPDKKALVIDFAEADREVMEGKVFPMIRKAGWWRDPKTLRKKSGELILAPLREKVERAAKAMAEIRHAHNIIDPDPETSSTVVSSSDRNVAKMEMQADEAALRITKLEAQFQQMIKLKPTEVMEALHIAEIEDHTVPKMRAALQDASVEATTLRASGIGEKHPRLLAVEQQIEVFQQTLADALTAVKQNSATKLEIERRSLTKLRNELKTASKIQVEDKTHVLEYLNAKTQYLRNKKVYETAQIKYEIEDLERQHSLDLR